MIIINELYISRNTQLNIKCSINTLVEDGLILSIASQRCDNLISPKALFLGSFPYGGFKRVHLPYLGLSQVIMNMIRPRVQVKQIDIYIYCSFTKISFYFLNLFAGKYIYYCVKQGQGYNNRIKLFYQCKKTRGISVINVVPACFFWRSQIRFWTKSRHSGDVKIVPTAAIILIV